MLICPACSATIKLEGEVLACINRQCLCMYQIENDIPVMLIDKAKRPCPKCGIQRNWLEEKNLLQCPKCEC